MIIPHDLTGGPINLSTCIKVTDLTCSLLKLFTFQPLRVQDPLVDPLKDLPHSLGFKDGGSLDVRPAGLRALLAGLNDSVKVKDGSKEILYPVTWGR